MKIITGFSSALIALVLLSACGTPAHRTSPDGQGLTTVRGLDFKDYQIAAESMINALLDSGRLPPPVDGRPPVIQVSRVINSTSSHLDSQLLTQKITIALDKSGKAVTTAAVAQDGAFDPAVRGVRNLADEEMFDPETLQRGRTVQAPSLSLAGQITELYRQQGRNREAYYMFYMTVTDLRTGLILWQDEAEVVKRETRPLISL
jgi:uncharacterized protein (TIGR02722 family)